MQTVKESGGDVMDDMLDTATSPPEGDQEDEALTLSDSQDVSAISEKSKQLVSHLVRALEIAERHLDANEVALPYELFTQMLWSQTFRYATYMLDLSESESFDKDMLVRYMKSLVAPDSDDLPPAAQVATEIFKPGSRTKADGVSSIGGLDSLLTVPSQPSTAKPTPRQPRATESVRWRLSSQTACTASRTRVAHQRGP